MERRASGVSDMSTTLTVQSMTPGPSIDKSRCLETPAGRFGTYACGYLRLAYSLPSTKTMGRTWTPTLLFSSEHLVPAVRFNANVSVSSSATIDSVQLKAYWGGEDTITRGVVLPNDGQLHRVALEMFPDTAFTPPTGLIHYTIKATAFSGYTAQAVATDTGTTYVVSRAFNNFRGWWLAGLEQLSVLTGGQIVWIGGDGSTRLYKQIGSSSTWTVANTVDRPDTLVRSLVTVNYNDLDECYCDTVWKYQRLLPNAAYVEFDNAGRHAKTVNAQGLVTQFAYGGYGPAGLDHVTLPLPAGSSASRTYQFQYVADSTGYGWTGWAYTYYNIRPKIRIKAPSVGGVQRNTDLILPSYSTIGGSSTPPSGAMSIINPKGDTLVYTLPGNTSIYGGSVVDRTHKTESFGLLPDGLLRSVTDVLWHDTNQDDPLPDTTVVTTFCPAEHSTLGTCAGNSWDTPPLAANVRTIADGM